MAHEVIWISLAFLFYVHIGYPLLLFAWNKISYTPVRKGYWEPSVTVVIAAHNEEENIERKLLNILDLDYPATKLQVVVALDAPTDHTANIAKSFECARVQLVRLMRRNGKAGALNHAVSLATGDILVFADARQPFERDAIRRLVANFCDRSVGSVSGELVLLDDNGREATNGMGIYWRYEKWMRAREGEIHSMLGATGAIYAIRRELYQPIPADTILDDMAIPMNIVLRGKRAVFESKARAYDRVLVDPEAEYGRKVRTLMGNFQLLSRMPKLLSPFHNPVWIQFVSHKVARLAVPYVMVTLLVANLFATDGIYLWILLAQGVWHTAAFAGGMMSHRPVVESSVESVESTPTLQTELVQVQGEQS